MGRTVSSLLFWKWKWKLLSCVWLFATPRTIQPWNSPGQDTGVDNLSLLQGILPTQGSNPGLPHCRWILYQLSHTWHQTMVEVMKIMVTSFKKSHAHTATLSAPNPAAGHHWPTPLLETPGHSQASMDQSLVGSLLLSSESWCTQGPFVCALQDSVSLILCKFWWLYGGIMVTSSKRAYARPRSTAPRASAPAAGHCWPIPLQETFKHSFGSVSVRSLGPGAHKFHLSPLSISGRYGFWL